MDKEVKEYRRILSCNNYVMDDGGQIWTIVAGRVAQKVEPNNSEIVNLNGKNCNYGSLRLGRMFCGDDESPKTDSDTEEVAAPELTEAESWDEVEEVEEAEEGEFTLVESIKKCRTFGAFEAIMESLEPKLVIEFEKDMKLKERKKAVLHLLEADK